MNGAGSDEVEAFLADLRARGRSEHTERSYAKGLDHFSAWLNRNGVDLDDVTKTNIATYIAEFATEPRAGATASGTEPREPRTVNHRLSVLGSFFAFLIERDTERDDGLRPDGDEPQARAGEGPKRGEPAGQIAARELEVERTTSALRRARELQGDVAEAIEAQAR